MCTLAIYFQSFADYPLVIAANRDEFIARPALPPTLLLENPRVVGGKDLKAGGTWLGINQYGLIAGLLNRRSEQADPDARSRGLLCLDALRCATVAEAAAMVRAQRGADYNPFNLLVASPAGAFVAYHRAGAPDGKIDIEPLAPGLHLLSNLDLDDFECPKISRSYRRFAELAEDRDFARDPIAKRGDLARLLADHSTQLDSRSGRPNALCLHLGEYGTRSSSLIFVGKSPATVEHFFAPGPPCVTAYEPALTPAQSMK
ncbi:MAG: NRDE family protein [Candidatus Binatales bacterium]